MKCLFSIVLLVLVGCASRPVAKVAPMPIGAQWATVAGDIRAADTEPAPLRGCQWDWAGLPGEVVTFEVWASVDLVRWQLATNTTERIALFPEKPMEFYRVRSRNALGSVSDWATVSK